MTELNNESMNTIVETFLVEETVDLIYDNDELEKWNNLVGELGLQGQTKIVKPDKSPIPFMHMKTGTVNIFNTLCPRHVDVSEFDVTPIPVEILDLIALSKREGYFTNIEVWYDERQKDPAVIGQIAKFTGYWGNIKGEFDSKEDFKKAGGESGYWDVKAQYLIGKWGDVKRSMDELKEMAKKRFIEEKRVTIEEEIKRYKRELEDLELTAIKHFN